MIDAPLNTADCMPIALGSIGSGTRRGTIDCRAGLSKANAADWIAEPTSTIGMFALPLNVSTASAAAFRAIVDCVMRRRRRRSTRSATAPASSVSSRPGTARARPARPR